MEQATTVEVSLPDRTVTLAVNGNQLAARSAGDLITAEIVSVTPASYPASKPY